METLIIPIEFMSAAARLLWPRFVVQDGLIFVDLPGQRRPSKRRINRSPKTGLDNTGIEAFQNHTHILDLFKHDPRVWQARVGRFNRSHPQFRLAERLGVVVAEAWLAKLRRDFPGDHFRVYYTGDEDPIVRFHRLYPGESVWLDDSIPAKPRRLCRIWDTTRIG
jgi:hypothetical protein